MQFGKVLKILMKPEDHNVILENCPIVYLNKVIDTGGLGQINCYIVLSTPGIRLEILWDVHKLGTSCVLVSI